MTIVALRSIAEDQNVSMRPSKRARQDSSTIYFFHLSQDLNLDWQLSLLGVANLPIVFEKLRFHLTHGPTAVVHSISTQQLWLINTSFITVEIVTSDLQSVLSCEYISDDACTLPHVLLHYTTTSQR